MLINEKIIDLRDCEKAKKGKRFGVALLDYFILVFFSFSLFALVGNPIFNALPAVKKLEEQSSEDESLLLSIVAETSLQSFDSRTMKLSSITKDGDKYIRSLVKTSFYRNNEDYKELENNKEKTVGITTKDLVDYQEDGKYVNNNILQYQLHFRNEHLSDFDVNLTVRNLMDIQIGMMKLDSVNKDLIPSGMDLSKDVFYLDVNIARDVLSYFNYGSGRGRTYYNRLLDLYGNNIKEGVREIEEHYSPFRQANETFTKDYKTYVNLYQVMMILCYVVAFLICYLLFPVLLKYGRSIGFRFFALASLCNDLGDMKWYNHLIRGVVLFFMSLSSLFFDVLLFGKLQLMSVALIGPFSLFQFILFSFLLSVLSLVFFFISKDNIFISDLASNSFVVDTDKHYGVRKDEQQ